MVTDFHGALDERLFLALNAGLGEWVDRIGLGLSAHAFGFATAVVLSAAILAIRGRRGAWLVLALLLAVGMSDGIGSQVVRPLIGRMRPLYALPPGTFRALGRAANGGSLPSLHAANFFAMATVAWAASRPLGVAAGLVAAAVAWSRVYLGVHWPTDVIAGAAWGIGCALAARAIAGRLQARFSASGSAAP